MKKQLATLVVAIVVGVLGFAVAGVAVAAGSGKPPSPPGQGPCAHGNSGAPCRPDPSPNGQDCQAHGNEGGVNQDHCQTTTETTTTETTTPGTTTPGTTTTGTTTTGTTTTPTIVGEPPVAAKTKTQASVAGVTANAPKPTHQPQDPPFTL